MSDKFDLVTMHDAFLLFEQQETMRGVICQYAGRAASQVAATPRVRWEPSNDRLDLVNRSAFAVQPRPPGGTNKLSGVRAKHVREAGATLFLFDHDDDTEELIARVVLALEDTFGAEKNCRILSGGWNLARAQSTSSERYALHIAVAIPIIRILPAANVAGITTTGIPEVP